MNLFLVRDIIDGWRRRNPGHWDEHHDDVLRQILHQARSGTKVTYIPGNHDEMFRSWLPAGVDISGIKLLKEAEHTTADGKRFLIMHGDEFGNVVRCCCQIPRVTWRLGLHGRAGGESVVQYRPPPSRAALTGRCPPG